MLKHLNKIILFLTFAIIIILLMFNMASGVDCSRHNDSSSCLIGNGLKKIFYFPECMEAMERYIFIEQKKMEAKKEGKINPNMTGPFNPYSNNELTPLKCGIHDYFHPADQG